MTSRINDRKTEKISIRSISACAMLSAVAFVLQFLEFSLPIIPSFVKLDVSDIPALIGTFVLGPTWGIAIEFIKNLIHLPFGTSMGVGELCNFLLGSVFVFSAGLIYKFKHTRTGAIIASLCGALLMAIVSLPLNYFFVYPAYVVIYKLPLDSIIEMYRAILPAAASTPTDNALFNCLLIFNVTFTFCKGILEAFLCYIVYKPISRLYHR